MKTKIKLFTSIVIMVMIFMFISCNSSTSKKESDTHEHATTAMYACPMHPEITASEPGDCSECGMPLELQESEDMEHEH